MWDATPFSGTKIALICGKSIVAYLRDDKSDIPFPGMWDLPGGGREGDEAPVQCGLRELEEEFGLVLQPTDVFLIERHRSSVNNRDMYFCAIRVEPQIIEKIRFGDEGQRWEMLLIDDFVDRETAVPHLRNRVGALAESGLLT